MSIEYCSKCKHDVFAETEEFNKDFYQWKCPICFTSYTINYTGDIDE
ncbi:MAG: hypothetical protein KAS32_09780 [Candidatus Peribacteraceae bacterium]|nr:hypothetical protein [Candidatus Peribacteraceae bacterium]